MVKRRPESYGYMRVPGYERVPDTGEINLSDLKARLAESARRLQSQKTLALAKTRPRWGAQVIALAGVLVILCGFAGMLGGLVVKRPKK